MATNRRVYTFEDKKRFVNALLNWRMGNGWENRLGESSYRDHKFEAIRKSAFGERSATFSVDELREMWKNINKSRGGIWKYANETYHQIFKKSTSENQEASGRELVREDLKRIKRFVCIDTLKSQELQSYLNGSKRCGSVVAWNNEVDEFMSNLTDEERKNMSCRPGLEGILELEMERLKAKFGDPFDRALQPKDYESMEVEEGPSSLSQEPHELQNMSDSFNAGLRQEPEHEEDSRQDFPNRRVDLLLDDDVSPAVPAGGRTVGYRNLGSVRCGRAKEGNIPRRNINPEVSRASRMEDSDEFEVEPIHSGSYSSVRPLTSTPILKRSLNFNSTGMETSGSSRAHTKRPRLSGKVVCSNPAECLFTEGNIAGQSSNEVDWQKCMQWAAENSKRFDAMTADDWNKLIFDTKVSLDANNPMKDFFSNGIKKLMDNTGTSFSESLNLKCYNRFSKVVIFHCMDVVSVGNLKSVIETLIEKKVLSNEKIQLALWMEKFILDIINHSEPDPTISFSTSRDDFQRVKAAFQEELFRNFKRKSV